MDGIMLDLQAIKDTLIAIERETYNITAIIVRLLPQQNTLIELQAIKTSLLAIEDKTDILATIINTLLQESSGKPPANPPGPASRYVSANGRVSSRPSPTYTARTQP